MTALALIEPATDILPTALLQRVDSAIQASPHLTRNQLTCRETQGVVVLQGRVRSYFQKQMAQEVVRNLDGVQRIINDLQVEW